MADIREPLLELPFDIILQITKRLTFSDLWYLATCSHKAKKVAHKVIYQKYHINLARPRIINPFGNLVRAAAAFVGRHGYDQDGKVNYWTLQSVANHLAIAIYDRTPDTEGRVSSVDFLLDNTLEILVEHIFFDNQEETLDAPSQGSYWADLVSSVLGNKNVPMPGVHSDTQASGGTDLETRRWQSSGLLMAELLAALHPTLAALFDAELPGILHRLLIQHIDRRTMLLTRHYHHQPVCSGSHDRHQLRVLVDFFCALLQTQLVKPQDINTFAREHLHAFFVTQPQDISYARQGSLRLKTESLTSESRWKLWLDEIQFRVTILLDMMRALLLCHHNGPLQPLELSYLTSMLQETFAAFSVTLRNRPSATSTLSQS